MTAVRVFRGIRTIPAGISVPDNERGLTHSYPGHIVQRDGIDIGDLWRDADAFCWRTSDRSRYGREPRRADAIAKIVGRA